MAVVQGPTLVIIDDVGPPPTPEQREAVQQWFSAFVKDRVERTGMSWSPLPWQEDLIAAILNDERLERAEAQAAALGRRLAGRRRRP